MDQLIRHDPVTDEVEEVESILPAVGEVENGLLDFLHKQANFKELVFRNLDFLNLHIAGKVDSKIIIVIHVDWAYFEVLGLPQSQNID